MTRPNPFLFVEPLENRVCLSAATLTNDDKDFMVEKSVGNMTESRLGLVAMSKTSNVALQALAVRLVGNHSAAQQQLDQVAAADGVTLPNAPDYKHRKIIRWMSSLTGTDFDEAFARYMVVDHHQDITDYNEERKTTTDSGLVTYTTTQIPLLVRHLGLAEDGLNTIGVSSGTGTSTGTSTAAARKHSVFLA